MKFKGTSGEWVSSYDKYDDEYLIRSKTPAFIASTINSTEEDKANALLISKSPEMLEMLKDLLDSWENGNFNDEQFVFVKQLIKEATEIK